MICCFLGIQELNKIIGKLMAQGVPPFLVPFRNPFNFLGGGRTWMKRLSKSPFGNLEKLPQQLI